MDNSYYVTFQRPESTGLEVEGRWPWGLCWETCGRDSLLFLGSGSGVRILSVTDSVHPRMVGQIAARGLVYQLVVQDSLLFVACGNWGAQVYSVGDPANPRELGSRRNRDTSMKSPLSSSKFDSPPESVRSFPV